MEKVEQLEAAKLALLRNAWNEGIESGDAGELDFTVLKREARARLAARKGKASESRAPTAAKARSSGRDRSAARA